MASETTTTTDHEEIRRWAEGRGGRPVKVRGTELHIDFLGGSNFGELQPISWADWFTTFDDAGLALLYQEQEPDGSPSTFNQLVNADTSTPSRTAMENLRVGVPCPP